MKLKFKDSIPPGSYNAEFLGVEETNHQEYGPGLNWLFKVSSGKHKGQKTGRITAGECTKKNAAGKFLVALVGRSWDVAKTADVDDFIGTSCQIVVAETDSGATRVESFIPLREPDEDDGDDQGDGAPADELKY
jgi:hypothetical protein